MIFWVSGDMSEDLRIKKLRGSGGFVIAQVTDEQQLFSTNWKVRC